MRYIFHPDAENEYLKSIEFYENRFPGLGAGFLVEFEESIAQVMERPEIAEQKYDNDIRGKVLARFPYIIYYRLQGDTIQVLAIAHTSRRPGYWQYRDN